jgi:hypothetical protein
MQSQLYIQDYKTHISTGDMVKLHQYHFGLYCRLMSWIPPQSITLNYCKPIYPLSYPKIIGEYGEKIKTAHRQEN